MIPASERMIRSGPLEIWTEAFGRPEDPMILLIVGAINQGIFWPDGFCAAIAREGYRTIRYDHRDTGQSSTVDWKRNPYDLRDLARDAVAILDAYDAPTAHVVGMSMGGLVAQILALDWPARVRTLTLLMSTPDERPYLATARGQDTGGFELPPPCPRLAAHMRSTRLNPPRTEEEHVENAVEGWRICNGDVAPFDAEAMRRLQSRIWRRARNPAAALRHFAAVAATPPRADRLERIAAPTLVIHGGQDPCLPVEHGAALAGRIPSAQLVIVPEMGHMPAPSLLDRLAAMIVRHVRRHS